eukprot:3680131-Prymnesium_polylepis.1
MVTWLPKRDSESIPVGMLVSTSSANPELRPGRALIRAAPVRFPSGSRETPIACRVVNTPCTWMSHVSYSGSPRSMRRTGPSCPPCDTMGCGGQRLRQDQASSPSSHAWPPRGRVVMFARQNCAPQSSLSRAFRSTRACPLGLGRNASLPASRGASHA